MAVAVREARRDADLEDVTALWGEYLRWANDRFDAEYGFRLDVDEVLARNLADLSPLSRPAEAFCWPSTVTPRWVSGVSRSSGRTPPRSSGCSCVPPRAVAGSAGCC
jgi:hypothetical protein